MRILNISAGKFDPLPSDDKENLMIPKFIVNLDTSYFGSSSEDLIEQEMDLWQDDPDAISKKYWTNCDAFSFMERTRSEFDRVCIYRFLEHVTFTSVEYFIYLVSTITEKNGIVDVIVPDYKILAEMILNEDALKGIPAFNFQNHNILLTTELLNEPSCPHASIWTSERIKYFWELEERFVVEDMNSPFTFDGRDIYLRAKIKRI